MAAVQGDASAASRGTKKRGSTPNRSVKEENVSSKRKRTSNSSSSPPPQVKIRGAVTNPPPTTTATKSPQKPGLMDWEPKDLETLINKLSDQLPKVDNVKYSTQMEKVDWKKVGEDCDHSAAQCRDKWGQIITKIRRFRTLTELVIDAKEWVKHPWTTFNNPKSKNKHPDLPKKPLTPYFRYFLEKREKHSKDNPSLSMTELAKKLAQKFAELSEKKKQKYKDSYERESEEYKVLMEKFRAEHPEMYTEEHRGIGNNKQGAKYSGPQKPHTPAQLFLAEKMMKHTNLDPAEKKEYEEKYRLQWKALTEAKRVKWIRKALADEQRYAGEVTQFSLENPTVKVDPIKSVISKAEKDIKERIEGKPEKPPNSGYSLYSKIMLKQLKDIPSKEKMAEISKRWKMLNEKEKQNYTREALDATERYHTDYASYIAKLPEDERKKIEEEKGKGKRKAPASGGDGTADGAKPKKPLSALFFYQRENLESYRNKYPDKSEQDLTRTMARDYGELADKKREYYKKMEEVARKENTLEMAKDSKNKRKGGTKLFKGEPKKPPQSGYLLFTMDAIAKMDIEPKERMTEIAKRWRLLKPSEQEKYKKRCTEQMKKYNKELAKFEASLSDDERKQYQQFKGSGKKPTGAGTPLKKVRVVVTENDKGSDDEDNDESDKDDDDDEEEGDNESSNSSDSSDDDSSDDESGKSESGSGSKSGSESSSSDSESKNESSGSSSEESSDESGSESESGSDSDK